MVIFASNYNSPLSDLGGQSPVLEIEPEVCSLNLNNKSCFRNYRFFIL